MIIYRSPYRISLFGGGTDYKSYIYENGTGMCIGFAIDKYSYISIRELPPFFPFKTKLSYSEIELVKFNEEIKHSGIRHTIERFEMLDWPLEIHHTSDLPAKTGLGTSSSFLVALCAALHDLKFNVRPNPSYLGSLATNIEQKYSNVGIQDHFFSAHGGFGKLIINKLQVDYLKYNNKIKDIFEKNGLLFFTGIERNASDIVGKYINKLATSDYQNEILNIAHQVDTEILANTLTLPKAGQYLHETWNMKKLIDKSISNSKIDNIYYNVLDLGAYGGKLCGAGAGGCLFFLSEPKDHAGIIEYCENQGCINIPYRVSEEGVKRIL